MTTSKGGPALGLIDTGLARLRAFQRIELVVRELDGGGDDTPARLDHGTFSLSLIAARLPGARVHVAAVADRHGRIAECAVADAIDWLVAGGCRIIAIPLGRDHDAPTVAAALARAVACGADVFAAAGDSHPAPVVFPARAPGVRAIGAIDRRGCLLAECNRHPRLDALAPGHARGLVPDGRREVRRGSSIACVLAAAAAARAASNAPRRP